MEVGKTAVLWQGNAASAYLHKGQFKGESVVFTAATACAIW